MSCLLCCPVVLSAPQSSTNSPLRLLRLLPAAVGGALIAGLIGVPLIKRQVERDWEELNKPEVIPELHAPGAKDSDVRLGWWCGGMSRMRRCCSLRLH